MLYSSQARSVMKYSPLVWSSLPPSFLALLDRLHQARRHMEARIRENDRPVYYQSLQHRRDMAALCVIQGPRAEFEPTDPSAYNTRNILQNVESAGAKKGLASLNLHLIVGISSTRVEAVVRVPINLYCDELP